jgi:hypothetical protein
MSVLRWALHAVDDENFDWAFSGFDLEAKLFLKGRE